MSLDHLDHAADAILDGLLTSTSPDILPDDLRSLMDQAGMTAREPTPDADLDDLLATIPAAAPSLPDVPQSPPSTPALRVYRRLGDTIAFLRSQGHHNLARQVLVAYSCKAHGGDPLRYQREVEPEREPVIAPEPPPVAVLATVPAPPQQVTVNNAAPEQPAPQITVNVPEAKQPQVTVSVPRYKKVIHRDERGLIVEITDELMTP